MVAERFSKRPFGNKVRSSHGFSVELLGRTGIRYAEEGRSLIADSEKLAEHPMIALFADSIGRWEAPDGDVPLSDVDRVRVYANIRRALEWWGFRVVD